VRGGRLTERALNRALLARQGLLERWRRPVAETAAVAGAGGWWPAEGEPAPAWEEFRSDLLAFTAAAPRHRDEVAAFAEAWIGRRPDVLSEAALAHHRQYSWRTVLRWSSFVRAPIRGSWGPRAPEGMLAAPCPPSAALAPRPEEAQAAVVRRHLRAFGPAAAEDVAAWVNWRTPAARAVLDRLAPELERFEDEAGRQLYDLPDAPRPDPDVPAPVRFLPAFDSVQLAYAPRRRQRFLPDAYRDLIYVHANGQVLPAILVDGLVAGRWSLRTERRAAVLSLVPFARLPRAACRSVEEEAERLARFAQPAAKTHAVEVVDG
jgi:hypothetical protein